MTRRPPAALNITLITWQLRQQLPLTNCPEGANGAKAVNHGGLACGSVACVADAGQNGGHDRAVCQGNATALKPVNQTFEDLSMTFGRKGETGSDACMRQRIKLARSVLG